MKLLAFDTSTDTLSVALSLGAADAPLVLQSEGSTKASATLIPLIHELLGRGGVKLSQLDAIVFGRGPGSFTGLRTACSVAQGLAFGAGVPVLPVDTLMAVAQQARLTSGASKVIALLDARMDQVYCAAYARENAHWRQEGDFTVGSPESVIVPEGWTLAGNAFAAYDSRLPTPAPRVDALPTAEAMLMLAPALLSAGGAVPADRALPLYIRDKVAQTTQEREVARAAATSRP